MNKLLSFTISLATQVWSLFVLMTVWNWFASDWHVFTMMQLMWLQLFGRLLLVTPLSIMSAKSVDTGKLESVPANVALSILFLLVLAVAYVVKCI